MRTQKPAAAVALTAVTIGLAGCGVSAGTEPPPPSEVRSDSEAVTLELAGVNGFADEQLALLLSRVKPVHGIRLQMSPAFDSEVLGVEQRIIEAVRDGELDLGWVGARAFSELGIHDFDALIAPMLISSLDVQEDVLDSDIPARMLAGLQQHGLTGLAIIAGPLRRPVSVGTPLADEDAFDGTSFYAWHGDIPMLALAAVGAIPIDAGPSERNAGLEDGSIGAFETPVGFLADWIDGESAVMTGNLSLWPGVGVIIADPESIRSLTDDQRAMLMDAVNGTARDALTVIVDDHDGAIAACAAGARFVNAAPDALVRVRERMEPVYDRLREDDRTRGFLDEISGIAANRPPDAIEVPPTCAG